MKISKKDENTIESLCEWHFGNIAVAEELENVAMDFSDIFKGVGVNQLKGDPLSWIEEIQEMGLLKETLELIRGNKTTRRKEMNKKQLEDFKFSTATDRLDILNGHSVGKDLDAIISANAEMIAEQIILMNFEECSNFKELEDYYQGDFQEAKRFLIEKIKERFYNKSIQELTLDACLLYTSPSPRDRTRSRMPSSA